MGSNTFTPISFLTTSSQKGWENVAIREGWQIIFSFCSTVCPTMFATTQKPLCTISSRLAHFCLARTNATNVCTQMSMGSIEHIILSVTWWRCSLGSSFHMWSLFIAVHTSHILRPLYICFTLLPRGQEFAALCRLPSCRSPCTDYQVVDCRVLVDCRVQIAVCLCIAAVCGAFSHGQFKAHSLLLRLVMVISQLWDLNSSQLIQSTTIALQVFLW